MIVLGDFLTVPVNLYNMPMTKEMLLVYYEFLEVDWL